MKKHKLHLQKECATNHSTFPEIKDDALRHAEYRRVMTSLPLVARNTARKLFAHLHFLTTMAHANKMGAENLASVWAPTVMPAALVSVLTLAVPGRWRWMYFRLWYS